MTGGPRPLPLVSVIATSFNHERFVLECLESVGAQSYPNVELIVVDDCSTDGTVPLIRGWLARAGTQGTLVVHDINLGICATKNDAIARASGVYVAGIATDDMWPPERLARQVERLEALPETTGVVYSDAERIDEAGRLLPGTFIEQIDSVGQPPSGNLFETLLERNFIPAGATLIRRACLEEVGPYDESLVYEDWDMWLRLARRYEFAFVPGIALRYRLHESSASHVMTRHDGGTLWWETEMKIMLKHLGYTPEWDATLWDRIARAAFRLGRPEQLEYARAYVRTRRSPRALALYALCRLGVPYRLVRRLTRAARATGAAARSTGFGLGA
jgi:glycosyltransferase involved in cell wall biosynthesis